MVPYRSILILFMLLCILGIFVLLAIAPYKNSITLKPKLHLLQSYDTQSYQTIARNSKTNILLNLTNFEYKIDTHCNTSFLIWIVTSHAADPSPRSALRRAYSNKELEELGVRRVFLLGQLNGTTQEKTHVSQNSLINESERFNDIIQGNFIEAYRNLTYKHLMGLRWAADNCADALYLMKMDDDIILNLYEIIDMLKTGKIREDRLTGYVLKNAIPVRERASKWYVNKDEYKSVVYPNFLSGWLYISGLKIVRKIADYSKFCTNYFWIDDVFLTGIIRRDLNIQLQSINNLYALDHRYLNCCIKEEKNNVKCKYLVGPNGGDVELQVRFADFVKYCRTNCSVLTKDSSVNDTCFVPYSNKPIFKAVTAKIQLLIIP